MDSELRQAIFDILEALKVNVQRYMDQGYKDSANKPMDLHKDSGVGKSTIQRILKGPDLDDPEPLTPNLETVVRLCWTFEIPLHKLLTLSSKRARLLIPPDDDQELQPPELKRRGRRKTAV